MQKRKEGSKVLRRRRKSKSLEEEKRYSERISEDNGIQALQD